MRRLADKIAAYYPVLEKLAAGGRRGEQDRFGAGGSARGPALSAAALDRFGAVLKSLQRGLTGDRLLAGASYFSREWYLGAYLLYYWPVSYAQTSLALTEIGMRGVLPKIGKVLDIGAGPGPASFAAADFGAESLTLADSSGEALSAALSLNGNLPGPRPEFAALQRDFEIDGDMEGGPYDLIVACHSANELWKGSDDAVARRASLFENAVDGLTDGGILLVVEPSADVTGRPALALRDSLLERRGKDGVRCVAPCPGSFPCPILSAGEGRSCHSTWAWEPSGPVAALAAAAGLDRDSVKATWFALKKGGGAEVGALPPAARTASRPPGRLEGRIVSEPMLNKAGRVRYIVCTASGLATISAKAEDHGAREAGFFSLGRGDCIAAEALEPRANERSFGFAAGTRLGITLKAPAV